MLRYDGTVCEIRTRIPICATARQLLSMTLEMLVLDEVVADDDKKGAFARGVKGHP